MEATGASGGISVASVGGADADDDAVAVAVANAAGTTEARKE